MPGFSRPPSLAELERREEGRERREERREEGREGREEFRREDRREDRREEESLEIIVSGSQASCREVVYSSAPPQGYYDPLAPALERLHQHSIESSVVTEGHYDASFETEDFPTGDSFDVCVPGYSEMPMLSNGHFPGSQAIVTNGLQGPVKPARSLADSNGGGGGQLGSNGRDKTDLALANLTSHGEARMEAVKQQQQTASFHPSKIQSIPSEVELVTEGDEGMPGSVSKQQAPGGIMMWKRVRHCVVFGGTVVKKEKKKK